MEKPHAPDVQPAPVSAQPSTLELGRQHNVHLPDESSTRQSDTWKRLDSGAMEPRNYGEAGMKKETVAERVARIIREKEESGVLAKIRKDRNKGSRGSAAIVAAAKAIKPPRAILPPAEQDPSPSSSPSDALVLAARPWASSPVSSGAATAVIRRTRPPPLRLEGGQAFRASDLTPIRLETFLPLPQGNSFGPLGFWSNHGGLASTPRPEHLALTEGVPGSQRGADESTDSPVISPHLRGHPAFGPPKGASSRAAPPLLLDHLKPPPDSPRWSLNSTPPRPSHLPRSITAPAAVDTESFTHHRVPSNLSIPPSPTPTYASKSTFAERRYSISEVLESIGVVRLPIPAGELSTSAVDHPFSELPNLPREPVLMEAYRQVQDTLVALWGAWSEQRSEVRPGSIRLPHVSTAEEAAEGPVGPRPTTPVSSMQDLALGSLVKSRPTPGSRSVSASMTESRKHPGLKKKLSKFRLFSKELAAPPPTPPLPGQKGPQLPMPTEASLPSSTPQRGKSSPYASGTLASLEEALAGLSLCPTTSPRLAAVHIARVVLLKLTLDLGCDSTSDLEHYVKFKPAIQSAIKDELLRDEDAILRQNRVSRLAMHVQERQREKERLAKMKPREYFDVKARTWVTLKQPPLPPQETGAKGKGKGKADDGGQEEEEMSISAHGQIMLARQRQALNALRRRAQSKELKIPIEAVRIIWATKFYAQALENCEEIEGGKNAEEMERSTSEEQDTGNARESIMLLGQIWDMMTPITRPEMSTVSDEDEDDENTSVASDDTDLRYAKMLMDIEKGPERGEEDEGEVAPSSGTVTPRTKAAVLGSASPWHTSGMSGTKDTEPEMDARTDWSLPAPPFPFSSNPAQTTSIPTTSSQEREQEGEDVKSAGSITPTRDSPFPASLAMRLRELRREYVEVEDWPLPSPELPLESPTPTTSTFTPTHGQPQPHSGPHAPTSDPAMVTKRRNRQTTWNMGMRSPVEEEFGESSSAGALHRTQTRVDREREEWEGILRERLMGVGVMGESDEVEDEEEVVEYEGKGKKPMW